MTKKVKYKYASRRAQQLYGYSLVVAIVAAVSAAFLASSLLATGFKMLTMHVWFIGAVLTLVAVIAVFWLTARGMENNALRKLQVIVPAARWQAPIVVEDEAGQITTNVPASPERERLVALLVERGNEAAIVPVPQPAPPVYTPPADELEAAGAELEPVVGK